MSLHTKKFLYFQIIIKIAYKVTNNLKTNNHKLHYNLFNLSIINSHEKKQALIFQYNFFLQIFRFFFLIGRHFFASIISSEIKKKNVLRTKLKPTITITCAPERLVLCKERRSGAHRSGEQDTEYIFPDCWHDEEPGSG